VAVDAPEHVIGGDVLVEAEIIERPRRRLLNPPSSPFLPQISRIQRITPKPKRQRLTDFVNDIRHERTFKW
jgi:hypothetical protein